MRVEKIKVNKDIKLSKYLLEMFNDISYKQIQVMLRKKDIKVNGKRISQDIDVFINDEIIFYLKQESQIFFYEEVYEDENIFIVNKKRGIEVESTVDNDLVCEINKIKNIKVYPVHRLDRNTEGLVVFAKNIDSKT